VNSKTSKYDLLGRETIRRLAQQVAQTRMNKLERQVSRLLFTILDSFCTQPFVRGRKYKPRDKDIFF
jgi:hypothetical protein